MKIGFTLKFNFKYNMVFIMKIDFTLKFNFKYNKVLIINIKSII
jgi:hypothetical protein